MNNRVGYAVFGKHDGLELFVSEGCAKDIEKLEVDTQLELEKIKIVPNSTIYSITRIKQGKLHYLVFTLYRYAKDYTLRDAYIAHSLILLEDAYIPSSDILQILETNAKYSFLNPDETIDTKALKEKVIIILASSSTKDIYGRLLNYEFKGEQQLFIEIEKQGQELSFFDIAFTSYAPEVSKFYTSLDETVKEQLLIQKKTLKESEKERETINTIPEQAVSYNHHVIELSKLNDAIRRKEEEIGKLTRDNNGKNERIDELYTKLKENAIHTEPPNFFKGMPSAITAFIEKITNTANNESPSQAEIYNLRIELQEKNEMIETLTQQLEQKPTTFITNVTEAQTKIPEIGQRFFVVLLLLLLISFLFMSIFDKNIIPSFNSNGKKDAIKTEVTNTHSSSNKKAEDLFQEITKYLSKSNVDDKTLQEYIKKLDELSRTDIVDNSNFLDKIIELKELLIKKNNTIKNQQNQVLQTIQNYDTFIEEGNSHKNDLLQTRFSHYLIDKMVGEVKQSVPINDQYHIIQKLENLKQFYHYNGLSKDKYEMIIEKIAVSDFSISLIADSYVNDSNMKIDLIANIKKYNKSDVQGDKVVLKEGKKSVNIVIFIKR